MEDILEGHSCPHDPKRPLVCIDEASKPQVQATREPLPRQAGKPQRYDDEDAHHGVSHRLMLFAPLEGWRRMDVTDRRTSVDFAHGLTAIVDVHFPEAEQVVLVSDHLNTHQPAALYEAFAPAARHMMEKLAWHDTPKHGSWLERAEIELSVLQWQCLDAASRIRRR